jgi:hypothetical protein
MATCQANDGAAPCDATPKNNVWAQVQVVWARLLLSSSETIAHSGESGNVLAGKVRGTGHLIFTASEPAGPGIYSVSVAIDGHTVSSTVPNTNGGKCVPVGTDPATGALIFDYQQPCLTTEVIDAAVPTGGLPDGSHNVTISAADASGSSAPVFDDTVTTSNPQTTPNPTGRHALHARFVLSWRWSGATTLLRSIRVTHLLPGRQGGRALQRQALPADHGPCHRRAQDREDAEPPGRPTAEGRANPADHRDRPPPHRRAHRGHDPQRPQAQRPPPAIAGHRASVTPRYDALNTSGHFPRRRRPRILVR